MDPRIVRKKLELIEQLAVAESRPVEGWEVRTGLQLPAGDYQWLTAWEPVPLAD